MFLSPSNDTFLPPNQWMSWQPNEPTTPLSYEAPLTTPVSRWTAQLFGLDGSVSLAWGASGGSVSDSMADAGC